MNNRSRPWVLLRDTDGTWWIQLGDDRQQGRFRVEAVDGTERWLCYIDEYGRDWAISREDAQRSWRGS